MDIISFFCLDYYDVIAYVTSHYMGGIGLNSPPLPNTQNHINQTANPTKQNFVYIVTVPSPMTSHLIKKIINYIKNIIIFSKLTEIVLFIFSESSSYSLYTKSIWFKRVFENENVFINNNSWLERKPRQCAESLPGGLWGETDRTRCIRVSV